MTVPRYCGIAFRQTASRCRCRQGRQCTRAAPAEHGRGHGLRHGLHLEHEVRARAAAGGVPILQATAGTAGHVLAAGRGARPAEAPAGVVQPWCSRLGGLECPAAGWLGLAQAGLKGLKVGSMSAEAT